MGLVFISPPYFLQTQSSTNSPKGKLACCPRSSLSQTGYLARGKVKGKATKSEDKDHYVHFRAGFVGGWSDQATEITCEPRKSCSFKARGPD